KLRKNTKLFEQALGEARQEGLLPGRWVSLGRRELGLIVGYNDATFSCYPGHEYPLLVTTELGLCEKRLEDVTAYSGPCFAQLLSGEIVEVRACESEEGWAIVLKEGQLLDLDSVRVLLSA